LKAETNPDSASPKPATEKFPAPVYAETVLTPNFEDAKRFFLNSLLQMHYAHTLMLEKQGILTRDDARGCLQALNSLNIKEINAARYDGSYEDLFFFIEQKLAAAIGPDLAGKMHTARSRNDIDLTLYRMAVRAELLTVSACVLDARIALLELAEANVDTIMPAYTHTQPAQPSTFAHYLMAAIEFLGRDFERLRACWSTVNRNPLGACAITTTGFPIDRFYTAELLGFEGLQVNSYGAIAAVDYVTEAASAVAVCMVNLGKHVQDLLQWCTAEFGFLRLSDAYVQTSSIMPQKRNPVSLEHTRIIASKAFSQAQAVLTCAHNTPFGDIVDSEDDLQPLVFAMFTDAYRALKLFAGLMRHCEVNREHMALRAQGDFLAVTELADTLVRREGLSFRLAHRLVHAAVAACGKYDRGRMVDEVMHLAPEIIGRTLNLHRDVLLEALDAQHFVTIRDIPGGPAPKAVVAEIEVTRKQIADSRKWLSDKQQQELAFPQKIEKAKRDIMSSRH
jgi:argininosuccinate lyase